MARALVTGVLCVVLAATAAAQEAKPPPEQRWFYLSTNMLVDKNVDSAIALIARGAKSGYNGVLLTDSKFWRWDDLPAKYVQNVAKVRQACRDNHVQCIAGVCNIGYSNDLLSRDPNLAEGLPVVDAPFEVRQGKLVATDDGPRLKNGGFEQARGDMPSGWSFVDEPGKISFIDTQVKCEGKSSLRMQDVDRYDPKNGHGRAHQALAVQPFRNYHVSVMVKTEGFEAASEVRIAVLAGKATLNYHTPRIEKTQDWKRLDICFNSLDHDKVDLYLGVWDGKGGKIWWDDARVEPAGMVNVVRRDGAPLRVAGEDGKTIYVEGKDFAPIADPLLGKDPYGGEYTAWHQPPTPAALARGRLREGQKVLLSYYHTAVIYEDQVTCCMSEPKLYELLRWQVEQVRKNVQPDGYFMQHDEIRVQGWDRSCADRKLTCGQILADNVKRCAEIIRHADAGKPIYVWSDMFDPHHNAAKSGPYYLVKGDGPWQGSWEGLDKDVVVMNWNSDPGKRLDSLRFFASRGQKQMLAGYYDSPPANIAPWLADAAKVQGVIGVMYTTWQGNYADLEKFAAELRRP